MRPQLPLSLHRVWLRKAGYDRLAWEIAIEVQRNIKSNPLIKAQNFFASEPISGCISKKYGPVVQESFFDEPSLYGMQYKEIIAKRIGAVRTFVNDLNERQKERAVEAAISTKPVDIEIKTKKIGSSPSLSMFHAPLGPVAFIENIILCENPKIPKKIYEIEEENLGAVESIKELSGIFDNYYITRLFSAGLLGKKEHRHITATRWSITAVDDIISKQNISCIKQLPIINKIVVLANEHLFNKWVILLIPGKWEFENFEAWAPGSSWASAVGKNHRIYITREYEGYEGRTKYAESQAGGYYATRLAVSEHLLHIKKQAKVVVFREVSEQYQIPVGVWQVREGVRRAKVVCKTSDINEALSVIGNHLRIPLEKYIQQSRILGQQSLLSYL